MVGRVKGSNRLQEGGYLATHKQDFNAHVTGGDWRHTADQLDMNPALSNFSSDTVQGTLELIAGFAASAGSGFISVGNIGTDGYATGSYNVGSVGTPTFRDAMLAAFNDDRLQNGGIVLILAGTYHLSNTISVPSGITIIGENAGSIIINIGSDTSMFHLERGTDLPTIGGDSGGGPLSAIIGSPIDETRLMNLILSDNMDGYGGDAPTMTSVPMIAIEQSSHVHIDSIKFLGRIADGSVSGRDKTLRAIGTVSGGSSATFLTVNNCFFDGMGTAIRFIPGAGDNDHLVIRNCRARTFGTEDAGSPVPSDNCFASMTLCNLMATDNYYIGAGSYPTQLALCCFVISSAGVGGTDVRINVSGTTGGPSSGAEGIKSVLYDETNAIDFKSVVTNNNWGSDLDNRWFVTVGEGDNLADGFFGDFNGPGAIDILLSSGYNYSTTVIVNSGTYTVTADGNLEYNFISNTPAESNQPIFDLNLGAGTTDEISNRTFYCGNRLSGIKFRSNSGAGNYHSVRPGATSGADDGAVIDNCVFEDTCLSIDNSYTATKQKFIHVNRVKFEQTGTFSDNLSILLPNVDTVELVGCSFSGYGYAGLIGDDSSISFTTAIDSGKITLKDCIFNQTGYTIDDASPLGTEAYLVINNNTGSLLVDNCSWIVEASYGVAAVPSVTRTNANFESYLNWTAEDIYIRNSLFNCASQTYDVSGTDYMMPGTKLIPVKSLHMESSKVYSSLYQVGSDTSALADTDAEGITLYNNIFMTTDSNYNCQSLLDIDLDPSVSPNQRQINCHDNKFYVAPLVPTPSLSPVRHDASGTSYVAYGMVQIYSDDFSVNVHGNSFTGIIRTQKPAGFTQVSGLVIDNTRPSGPNTLQICSINNNEFAIANYDGTGTSTDSASACYVNCSNLSINGNNIRLNNQYSPLSSSTITCLYVIMNTVSGAATGIKRAIIANNFFSRRDDNEGLTSLLNGFIRIDALSEPGICYNNVFSDDTVDGTDTIVFSDDSTVWSSYNNVNEIYTITSRGEFGNLGLTDNGTGIEDVYVLAGGSGLGASLGSVVSIDDTDASTPVTFGYQDTSTEVDFKWMLPLQALVPNGATVIEVSVDVDVSSNPTTTSVSRLTVKGNGSADVDTQGSLTTAGYSHSLTSLTQRVLSGNYSYVELYARINSSGSINYTASPMTIKYKL